MSSNTSKQSVSKQTALAMNRALAAEHEAEQAIQACRQQAAIELENARRKARRIQQHTNKRISRISQRFSQRLKEQFRELARSKPTAECTPIVLRGDSLQQIIDSVADEILGKTENKL